VEARKKRKERNDEFYSNHIFNFDFFSFIEGRFDEWSIVYLFLSDINIRSEKICAI
jgi:hypothetical protein